MRLIAELHHDPAAPSNAVGIAARDGNAVSIASCLANLGADGRRLLADEDRRALWTRALRACPSAPGSVWSALSAAQQAETVSRIAGGAGGAGLIGRIGVASWTPTDAALRRRRINAAQRNVSAS